MAAQKGSRRGGRRRAFEVLYGLCFVPAADPDSLRRTYERTPVPEDTNPQDDRAEFAWDLVRGVWSRQQQLDGIIGDFSKHWKLARIAKVELTILRLGIFEMLHRDDIPVKVAINEAIELGKRYGDDNSRSFINGILDAVARALQEGRLDTGL